MTCPQSDDVTNILLHFNVYVTSKTSCGTCLLKAVCLVWCLIRIPPKTNGPGGIVTIHHKGHTGLHISQ